MGKNVATTDFWQSLQHFFAFRGWAVYNFVAEIRSRGTGLGALTRRH